MADLEPIPYRIRIGVTGHRTLPDSTALETLVRSAIDCEIENLFPGKGLSEIEDVRRCGITPIAFAVLSALAEGADRVVARAVLQYPGSRLDVVLPMTVEDYLEDFGTEDSKQEFRSLLIRSRQPVMLRSRSFQDDRRDPSDQADLRRDSYKHVGQYVVDHCDVLIAIWDGEPERGRGGTAEIVAYACEQKRPVIRVWDAAFGLYNAANNNGLDASALAAINRFNRRPIPQAKRKGYVASLDRDYFEKPTAASEVPVAARSLVNQHLFPFYAQASLVAKESQTRFYRAGKFTYVFSATAVGCVTLSILFPTFAAVGFTAELILLLIMVFTLRQARKAHAHQSWIEHRFLAERIRCGIFMAICGFDPRPLEVLPFMGHSQTINDWTVRVFDEIWQRLPPLKGCSHGECLMLNAYIRETWIGDQIRFHSGKARRERKSRVWLARASNIVLPTTIAAAALHLLFMSANGGVWEEMAHRVHPLLSFLALLFPAVAASLAGMEAHREHLRLEKRSENMRPQLERLNRQMASATDPTRFQSIVQELDELMLRETQDWLMLMRYVEIKAS